MNRVIHDFCVISLGVALLCGAAACAQGPAPVAGTSASPPPATKLEAFKPAAGTVVTVGYTELGTVSGSPSGTVSVDARELRDAKGDLVRGVVVGVTKGEYQEERAFIDTDELPDLLKGMDALLSVKTNPTTYESFEVRYTTKGELQLTAFNSGSKISYAVEAGRTTHANAFADENGFRRLRAMFQEASQKLGTLTAKD